MTDKESKFCIEYIKDYNATQAAIRAGYSEKTAQQISSENLSKPVIREQIGKLCSGIFEKDVEAVKTMIKAECLKIALCDIANFVDDDGQLNIEKLKENGSVISGLKVKTKTYPKGETETEYTFKMWDKIRAIEQLSKLHEFTSDNININNFTLADVDKKDLDL